MDVAFEVTKVRGPYGPNGRVNVTGQWVNQGYVQSWPLGIRQTLKLTAAQLAGWQICLDPQLPCLRNARWK